MTTNTRLAVVYIRAMTNHSKENQQWLIEKQVSGSEYHVAATFFDTCFGTSSISRRPGWQQLLEELQTDPNIHDVIIYNESQLSRRMSEVNETVQYLEDMDVTVRYAANGLGSNALQTIASRFIWMEERQIHDKLIPRRKACKRIEH